MMANLRRGTLLLGIAGVGLLWLPARAYSPPRQTGGGRVATLTLMPDFATGQVDFRGTVLPGELPAEAAALTDWGLGRSSEVWRPAPDPSGAPWNIQGVVDRALVEEPGGPDQAGYHLHLGPWRLMPGDSLLLRLPFLSVDPTQVGPPPDNLSALVGDEAPALKHLRYDAGDEPREFEIDIPFSRPSQEIHLVLTPLIGEALVGRTDGLRLSGRVTYAGLKDYVEFERHCTSSPADPFSRYRDAHSLFTLDYQPVFDFGFLGQARPTPPTFALIRSEVSACEYAPDGGQVDALIAGRIFAASSGEGAKAVNDNGLDRHAELVGPRGSRGEYEIRLGEVRLGPDDRLTVVLADAELRHVSPDPSKFVRTEAGETQIEYVGPRRFALTIHYSPNPKLLLKQLPAFIRSLVTPIESAFGATFAQSAGMATWLALAVGAAALAAALWGDLGFGWWLKLAGLILIGAGAYFAVRSAYGLMILAVIIYAYPRLRRPRSVAYALGMLLVIVVALGVDAAADRLFVSLRTVDLEINPLTPLILSSATLLVAGLAAKERVPGSPSPGVDAIAAIVYLVALGAYDVLQSSFLALVLMALAAVYLGVALRARRQAELDPLSAARSSLGRVWRGRLVPWGTLALVVFAASHGLQSTAAVFGPGLGFAGVLLVPVLLVVSIVLAFTAIGTLFILLYPLLPFERAYLKAVTFSLFLWALFLFGVGSDDRLVLSLSSLWIGRLVYYMSVPLLISLFIEAVGVPAEPGAGEGAEGEAAPQVGLGEAMRRSLSNVQNALGTVRTLVSLAAPAVAAAVFGQPAVSSYFDLMDALIKFSVLVT